VENHLNMNRNILLVIVLLAVVGFTAFGFINKSEITTKEAKSVIEDQSTNIPQILDNFNDIYRDEYGLVYRIRGNYNRHLTEDKIKLVNSVIDFVEYYPSNWIEEYTSVELSAVTEDETTSVIGANENLTSAQKDIINTAKVGTKIEVKILYKSKNAITSELMDETMNFTVTVVPEKEAFFIGGYDKMMDYLTDNNLDEATAKGLTNTQQASVLFTINKEGRTENIRLIQTSGHSKADELFIRLIDEMPSWQPAENKGIKVKQEFLFTIGQDGC